MEAVAELNIKINESILFSLRETKKEFEKEMLFNNALVLYRKNKLSLGKASELAGYTKLDFIQKLKDENEYIFDYDEKEIEKMANETDDILTMIKNNK